MSSRGIGRISATGLLVAAAVGLASTSAFAADTDFGLDLTGVTLAADAAGKFATLTVTNHGTTTPETLDVRFDATRLDTSKVTVAQPDPRCRVHDGIATCRLRSGEVPGPGRSADLPFLMEKVAGTTGAAGELTVTVTVAGDTHRADNSKTLDVTVGASGTDLTVHAEDVTIAGPDDEPTGQPVPPGAVGSLMVIVVNQGDTTAAGLNIKVTLPQQSTVAQPVDGCEQAADKRSLTCTLDDVTLVPFTETEHVDQAAVVFLVPVRVSPHATGPVSLPDGVVTAIALGHQGDVSRSEAAAALPDSFARPTTAELAAIDADPSDNTDHFAVLVAGPTGTGQTDGNQPDGSGSGGQAGGAADGQGPSLPVTGPALTALGGSGLAIAVLGVLLFGLARHRRVRLMTPDDGK